MSCSSIFFHSTGFTSLGRDYILSAGQDREGRKFVKIDRYTWSSLGLLNMILAYFRIGKYNLNEVFSATREELTRLGTTQGLSSYQITQIKKNTQFLNQKLARRNLHVAFLLPKKPRNLPRPNLLTPSQQNSIINEKFETIKAQANPKKLGSTLQKGELGCYENRDELILGLDPKAHQYYESRIGNGSSSAPPSCTLYATLFIDYICKNHNFLHVINNFLQKDCTTLSRLQIDIMKKCQEDLRPKLLRAKSVLLVKYIKNQLHQLPQNKENQLKKDVAKMCQTCWFENTNVIGQAKAVNDFLNKYQYYIRNIPSLRQLLSMTYLDDRFTVRDLQRENLYRSNRPRCISTFNSQQNNERKLSESNIRKVVNSLTHSTQPMSYAMLTNSSSKTFAIAYHKQAKMGIIFNTHHNSIRLVSEKGLFTSLKSTLIEFCVEEGYTKPNVNINNTQFVDDMNFTCDIFC